MERIALLGLGLIGGSLALALRQTDLAEHMAGYDVDPETTRRARERGVITHGYAPAEEAVGQADLVILATPIRAMPALLERIAPALKPGTLVTDTASTKQADAPRDRGPAERDPLPAGSTSPDRGCTGT